MHPPLRWPQLLCRTPRRFIQRLALQTAFIGEEERRERRRPDELVDCDLGGDCEGPLDPHHPLEPEIPQVSDRAVHQQAPAGHPGRPLHIEAAASGVMWRRHQLLADDVAGAEHEAAGQALREHRPRRVEPIVARRQPSQCRHICAARRGVSRVARAPRAAIAAIGPA